jgi:hypothetical protein
VRKINRVSNSKQDTLTVSLGGPFTTFDPLDYDRIINHPVQSIVHGKLVSTYSPFDVRPQLADSWEARASDTIWKFRLRKGVSFPDGKLLTPEIVSQSLRRSIFLLKKTKSKNRILRNLKGVEEFNDLEKDELSGLKVGENSVELHFNAPMPKLLEMLSFGIWAIVHPESFEKKTGKWTAPNEAILGLGPYRFNGIEGLDAHFELKDNYPESLLAKNPFRRISVLGAFDVGSGADLIQMSSDNESVLNSHRFFGPRAMHIFYAQVMAANDKGRPLSDASSRRLFRDRFLKNVEGQGLKVVRSFFPLALTGVSENVTIKGILDSSADPRFVGKAIRNLKFKEGANPRYFKGSHAIGQTARELGASHGIQEIDFDSMLPRKRFDSFDLVPWDISLRGTGIAVDELDTDVRLMFSPEGINLPDPTGKIHKLLLESPLNLDAINKQLWEDGLIWPITHYSMGIWANDRVDFSEYNTLLPMGELQWVNRKD